MMKNQQLHSEHYESLYRKVYALLGDLTPLRADCGVLCNHACCKGSCNDGMRLFPHEPTNLPAREVDGGTLVVCDGSCDRNERPLACRIFPFFPTIDAKGRIFVEADMRAARLCPLISHSDDIVFDKRFFKALKRVGKALAKDSECRKFLEDVTEEIDTFAKFYSSDD